MTAIEIIRPGGPEVLVAVQRPRPVPGEVLIKVAAAGVNRLDVLQRLGKYPPPPGAGQNAPWPRITTLRVLARICMSSHSE